MWKAYVLIPLSQRKSGSEQPSRIAMFQKAVSGQCSTGRQFGQSGSSKDATAFFGSEPEQEGKGVAGLSLHWSHDESLERDGGQQHEHTTSRNDLTRQRHFLQRNGPSSAPSLTAEWLS